MNHHSGRDAVHGALRAELVGPDPRGEELSFAGDLIFEKREDAWGPWIQAGTCEEVLQRDPPVRRYGVGILYGSGVTQEDELAPTEMPPEDPELEDLSTPKKDLASKKFRERIERGATQVAKAIDAEGETEDFDLSGANSYKPSVIAVTFMVADISEAELSIEVNGGRYLPKTVQVEGKIQTWWLRQVVSMHASTGILGLRPGKTVLSGEVEDLGVPKLDLEPFCVVRPQESGGALVTVGLANRTSGNDPNSSSLFQTNFLVKATKADGTGVIVPYKEASTTARDDEESSIELLFREYPTFAVGHGCAADWQHANGRGWIAEVRGEVLPSYETPSITSDIQLESGEILSVPMAPLAGLVEGDNGSSSLRRVVNGYENWIAQRESEVELLEADYRMTAKRHLDQCRVMLQRMKSGLQYLESSESAATAFQLANRAILLQQIRAGSKLRRLEYDVKARRLTHSEPFFEPDPLSPPSGKGLWRPFQIAFLLASLESTVVEDHEDRDLVELIFFPTGGGKTEAYLGLAAFAIFFRRITNPDDAGTHILMRYTLRLLTAQQFQRAATLICAMESIRREGNLELGEAPFRIGIWVGGNTTPNTRSDAKKILKDLRNEESWAENKFILIRCPWCSAQIGPIEYKGKRPKMAPPLEGYTSTRDGVIFSCSDSTCVFSDQLPVVVVDEDVYDLRPDIVIGTVDKFARLAWTEASRSLFGIGPDGEQLCSPPGLIIQDELHLISGPLGSMVGLYEAIIEDLCSKRGDRGELVRPKIVSSTATIRHYQEQVRSLFARERTALFPPRGLDVSDSYFAQYARDENGTLLPGRRYVGVLGSSLSSTQTAVVRSFSSLLQGARDLEEGEARDPWWTLFTFFNSLHELGTSLSLLQSDIPDYLKTIRNRSGRDWSEMRYLNEPLELTGRLRSEEVPEAIAALEVSTTDEGYPVDVCLASNIVEVGIDIDRLSLMSIVGQPKTTSQYIQVSGRVGRRWWERPGLVVTIYGASRPRDRSHFERFRSFHERLYAQVEPTSITPFSPPVLERALHAVLISYVRQRGSVASVASPYPCPLDLLSEASNLLRDRARIVDREELETLESTLKKRIRQWENWQRTAWRKAANGGQSYLMHEAGSYVDNLNRRTTWSVPMSLRNVDAECQAVITSQYAIALAEEGVKGDVK